MSESLLLNALNQPNGNAPLFMQDYISRNIKVLAKYIADMRIKEVESRPLPSCPSVYHLQSKPSTQEDIESPWSRYWIHALKRNVTFHRKHWELSYVLQVLYENGMIQQGKYGLGLGCGEEPLPSFLASKGCKIVASDKPDDPEDTNQAGWKETSQHMESEYSIYDNEYLDIDTFRKNVEIKYIDMNKLPQLYDGLFDFCWSICVVEHLGSLEKGLNFLKNSLNLLKPGGISVHTTEFNMIESCETLDNWGSVLFQKKHFSALSEEVAAFGGRMVGCDFSLGNMLFDNYIDCPPFPHQPFAGFPNGTGLEYDAPHIKLHCDGFPVTCYGIILQKNK